MNLLNLLFTCLLMISFAYASPPNDYCHQFKNNLENAFDLTISCNTNIECQQELQITNMCTYPKCRKDYVTCYKEKC